MYASINEASSLQPVLAKGEVKIWYRKDTPENRGVTFTKAAIADTHVLMGSILGSAELDDIFVAMQGENWSPNGEARELIISKDPVYHTSMSTGDVIETADGKFWLVAFVGFNELE